MKEFFTHMYRRKNFFLRLVLVILSTIVMGFCLSWLVLCGFGTDPCTLMNLAISDAIGMPIGDWQALLNIFLFIFVVTFGGRNLGFGTLANMFLVGYSLQFFSWLWGIVLPTGLFDSMALRVAVLIPSLGVFVFAVAMYMGVDLGTSPYDAIPYIFSKWLPKVPFFCIRIAFDMAVIITGLLFGGKLGFITLVMAFMLGPAIQFVSNQLRKVIEIDD